MARSQSDAAASKPGHLRPKPYGFLRLCAINSFMFGFGLYLSTNLITTLPKEAERFFPEVHAVALGVLMAIAGFSQLSGPTAGFFSDRHVGFWGRRRPFMVAGYVVGVPAILVQWIARNLPVSSFAVTLFYVAFFVAMLALNVMYAGAAGLIPDLVPEHQMGQANGVLAFFTVAGACAGFGYFEAVGDVSLMYPMYALVLTVCTAITVVAAKEKSGGIECDPWTWMELADSYWVSRKDHPDFFWVFVSRILYYMGISCQAFLMYYFRDMVYHDGERLHDPERIAALAAVLGQVGGAVFAYPAGVLSDRVGRKPIITLSCIAIGVFYILLLLAKELKWVMALGGIMGGFNGSYLSVDYALAVDTLPSRDQAAKWLAVWGVAAFIGGMLGPAIGGPLLWTMPGKPPMEAGSTYHANSSLGYWALMVLGSAYMVASAATLRYVTKGAGPSAAQGAL